MRRPSWFHITTRSAFLSVALFFGLVIYYLPTLLELDRFRPQVTEALERTFRCRAIVGNIRGEIIPRPALVVGHVVLMEPSDPPRILASATAVRLWLGFDLRRGRPRFSAIRFFRPRFLV